MCNIILIKSNISTLTKDGVLSILPFLKTRGRDRYSMFIPSTTTVYSTTKFSELEQKISSLDYNFDSILLHSRAAPETEVHVSDIPSIYTDNILYVAHHGIVPNAEKIRDNVLIDSEAILTIYKDVDYSDLHSWFMKSLERYPRSTTEIVYDTKISKYIVATNFMPLYYYRDSSVTVYSTYKINSNYLQTYPYSITVV